MRALRETTRARDRRRTGRSETHTTSANGPATGGERRGDSRECAGSGVTNQGTNQQVPVDGKIGRLFFFACSSFWLGASVGRWDRLARVALGGGLVSPWLGLTFVFWWHTLLRRSAYTARNWNCRYWRVITQVLPVECYLCDVGRIRTDDG
jgi:hypothetical protein